MKISRKLFMKLFLKLIDNFPQRSTIIRVKQTQ